MTRLRLMMFTCLTLPLLSACSGDPEWVEVYEQCREQVTVQTEELKNSSSEDINDPQMQAMMNSMSDLMGNMGLSACEMIRSTCENNPDSEACQAIIQQSRSQQPE